MSTMLLFQDICVSDTDFTLFVFMLMSIWEDCKEHGVSCSWQVLCVKKKQNKQVLYFYTYCNSCRVNIWTSTTLLLLQWVHSFRVCLNSLVTLSFVVSLFVYLGGSRSWWEQHTGSQWCPCSVVRPTQQPALLSQQPLVIISLLTASCCCTLSSYFGSLLVYSVNKDKSKTTVALTTVRTSVRSIGMNVLLARTRRSVFGLCFVFS